MNTSADRITASDGRTYPRDKAAHREAIRAAIEADPNQTNTAIATRLHASRDLVIEVRKAMAGQAIIPRYESMCRAIAECEAVDEVKDMRDKAMALEVYARQAQNLEAERTAQRIRVRAEKQCGQLLKDMPKAKGVQMNGRDEHGDFRVSSESTAEEARTLTDLGITRDQSSQWQQLANVPDEAFEAALKDEFEPITAARIIERRQPPKPDLLRARINSMNPQALWICGRVLDFERDRLFDTSPHELFEAMTDSMRADMLRLVPRCVAFLSAMLEGASHE